MDIVGDDYTKQLAAFEDRMVSELLDKHCLKGKTKEDLRLLGYELVKGSDQTWGESKTTWKLYKFVDSISYKTELTLSLIYTHDELTNKPTSKLSKETKDE